MSNISEMNQTDITQNKSITMDYGIVRLLNMLINSLIESQNSRFGQPSFDIRVSRWKKLCSFQGNGLVFGQIVWWYIPNILMSIRWNISSSNRRVQMSVQFHVFLFNENGANSWKYICRTKDKINTIVCNKCRNYKHVFEIMWMFFEWSLMCDIFTLSNE